MTFRNSAVSAALDLARSPTLAAVMRSQPIPPNVLDVIRVAAGCQDTLDRVSDERHVDVRTLRAAAEMYLQKVLLFQGASKYRLLGLERSTSRDEARTNLKWLLMWLHPDRNATDWHRMFAARVLQAWSELNDPENVASDVLVPSHRHKGYRPPWIAKPLRSKKRLLNYWQIVGLIMIIGGLILIAFIVVIAPR